MTHFQFIRTHRNSDQDLALGLVKSSVRSVSEVNILEGDLRETLGERALKGLAFLAKLDGSTYRYCQEAYHLTSCPRYADWKIVEVPRQGILHGDATYIAETSPRVWYSRTGSPHHPATHTYPVGVEGDDSLTLTDVERFLRQVAEGLEQLGEELQVARTAVAAWEEKEHRSFLEAIAALSAGDPVPMRRFHAKEDPEAWTYDYNFCVADGPHGAIYHASTADAWEAQLAAKAFCAAREAAEKTWQAAARQARKIFQVKMLDALEASSDDIERASRGFFPPDELLERLLAVFVPSAEKLHCDGFVARSISLTADQFARLCALEAERDCTESVAREIGLSVIFSVVEATWERGYDDDEVVPALRINISDSTGESDWTRSCTCSLFPHSSTQSE